jgi:N-acetyl-anhydromuramyl-L-alanine amidase AmpD
MKYDEYPFIQAKHFSSRKGTEPEIILVHYTAGRGNSVRLGQFFKRGKRKASSHFGIGRVVEDGAATRQYVDTDKNAWHSGKAKFRDHRGAFGKKSIGIEICNTGWAYMDKIDDSQKFEGRHRNPASRKKEWEKFTEIQYDELIQLIIKLKKEHPSIKYITGHEDVRNQHVVKGISGSKTDPGPAFEWDREDLQNTLFDLGIEEWHYSFDIHEWYSGMPKD